MRRLWPDPIPAVTVAEQYTAVPRARLPQRPWVGVCMVASIDGSTAVGGRSGGLSSPADHSVLLALRDAADVVLVGAGTVRTEGYGVPRRAGLRIGVVTSTGNLDVDRPLFRSGAGFLVTTLDAPSQGVEAIRAGHGRVDLAAALAQLRGTFVHAEGGPQLNAALVAADLVDEVSLTVSPALVGGEGARVTAGAPDVTRRMQLAHVCEDDGFVFLRYVRVSPAA